MPAPFINKIKWRLTLAILGTSLVVLLLATVAVLIYDSVNSRQNLVSQVDTMAEITAANSSAALAFQDNRDAQETLNSLRARPEIDLACLYRSDGAPFVSFIRNGPGLGEFSKLPADAGCYFAKNRLILRRDVSFRDEFAGTILICANMKQQSVRAKTFLLIALVSLTGLIGVAMLLAARLQRLVSDPIDRLAASANHITKHNDYGVRFREESSYEISSLVAAFNQMLSEIDRQNRILVANESQLKLALSASRMGVWEWHLQTNAVTWSSESDQIFGPPTERLDLESFAALIHPNDVDRVIPAAKQAVEKLTAFTAEYRIAPPDREPVWVAHYGQVRFDAAGQPVVLAGIVQNISARKHAETERQRLIAQLLQAEEEERRRIARELHDTTAQHLAVLKIDFARLWNHDGSEPDPKLVAETRHLLDQAIQEIRTLTYVLHPPLLEEFGLVGAVRDFATGVTRRSNVQVRVHAEAYEGRLPRTMELALFRVVQESIANAIRHSGTKDISVRLARDPQEVRVEIQDFGHGFPAPPENSSPKFPRNSGVGLAAMQERLALVGGSLDVESDSEGVTVLAAIPLSPEEIPQTHSNPMDQLA
jgi:signal transduction histidine kinase